MRIGYMFSSISWKALLLFVIDNSTITPSKTWPDFFPGKRHKTNTRTGLQQLEFMRNNYWFHATEWESVLSLAWRGSDVLVSSFVMMLDWYGRVPAERPDSHSQSDLEQPDNTPDLYWWNRTLAKTWLTTVSITSIIQDSCSTHIMADLHQPSMCYVPSSVELFPDTSWPWLGLFKGLFNF